jgi:hypothetical protein
MADSSSSGGGFNILSHQVHEKLTLDNFLIWKAQVVPAVRGTQLMEFLEGTKVKPDEFITIDKPDKSKERVPNPACTTWLTQDAQLLSYLVSTMSKEVLAQVATCDTSAKVWQRSRICFPHSFARASCICGQSWRARARGSCLLQHTLPR